ncbi:hypothetical protein LTR84_009685 [Exophiala bonariae]|uniref:Uncharacterized protein n=1 Tax=Exophiala bonariae TaxID=1690606 RepID=A0AAV9NKK4_9EURO|nr:hypothetical protein LTR84_009685 [Exophiala bonariae]
MKMVQWPPTPCVEDEDISLAKEHVPDVHLEKLKSDDQPASSRGEVDQYPVILENPSPAQHKDSKTSRKGKLYPLVPDTSSPDEPPEPVTPPGAKNHERRFVFIPSAKDDPKPKAEPETTRRPDIVHRSKSTTQLKPDDTRGRPQVNRIQTDLGAGLEGMVTGQRRAPSPYAHARSSTLLAEPMVQSPRPNDTLLSPMSAHQPRRPASVHPGARPAVHDSSDSDHKPRVRRSERSRSRAARPSISHSDRSDVEKPRREKSRRRRQSPDSRSSRDYPRHRSRGPAEGGYGTYSYTSQDHITPPQTPKPSTESTRSSGEDLKATVNPISSRQPMRRGATDSPYTSSAEENHSRRYESGDERRLARGFRSRRASRSQLNRDDELRPQQASSSRRDRDRDRGYQTSDERNRFEGPRSPVAAQKAPKDPKAMEDYFEKAFEANQSKRSRQNAPPSQHASPMASPPRSPPRTPRGERAPREYFEPPSQVSKSSRQRSRPPSMDEGHFKDLKPLTTLLGAATLGASLAVKAIPSLSRSSTAQSVDSPSSGSLSRPSSGQRSRKPSPVSDETTPPAQPSSVPVSRHNSVTNREEGPSPRVTTYAVQDDRLLPRSVPRPATHVEIPRAASRASSYSHSPEQSRPAVLPRAFSSSIVMPGQQSLHLQPQQPLASSPLSPLSPPVPPPPANPLVKNNTLPPCPRSKPMAGCHDWYTLRDMPKMFFCPSCMNHLGSSPFRDYFVPNFSSDPYRPIACSMSNPWIRFAWSRTMKQENPNLTLLWKINSDPPPETKRCNGNQNDLRKWYHLNDPRMNKPVENFDVCSACVRNVDLLFPNLQSYLFDRPTGKLAQEKVCNMNLGSRNLPVILNELERLADWQQKSQLRTKDIHNFLDRVWRLCRYRDCAKDTMLGHQLWHHHPELPELTICEACFEEVVWPWKDRPIAKEVSKTVRQVPVLQRTQALPGISCQLYSDRMRRLFYEACSKNDFELLKRAARYRYDMEHRLQHNHRLYAMDMKAGIDRRADIESNVAFWKSIE